MRDPVQFFVRGHPRAQGSKRHVGGGIMVEAANLAPWRKLIIDAAASYEGPKFSGPIQVRFVFWFQRPKGHYGTGRNAGTLKRSAPTYRASAPDVDKLCRAVADALTISGLILDDRLIVRVEAEKRYGDPGVLIEIQDLEEPPCPSRDTPGTTPQSHLPTASQPRTEQTTTGAPSTSSVTITSG